MLSNTHWQDELWLFIGKIEPIEASFYPGGALGLHPDQGLHHLKPVEARLDPRWALQGLPHVPHQPLHGGVGQEDGRGSHLTFKLESDFFLETIPATCVLTHAVFCTLLSTLLSNVIIVLLLLLLQPVLLRQIKIISHSLNF